MTPAAWMNEDEYRERRAERAEELRDWLQWEAERDEPATSDGGWDA